MRQDFIKMWCNFIRFSQYVYLWQSSFQKVLKSIGIYTSKVTFWHCQWSLILYKRRKHSHQSWMTSKMLLWSLFVNKMLHFDIHIYTTHTHTHAHIRTLPQVNFHIRVCNYRYWYWHNRYSIIKICQVCIFSLVVFLCKSKITWRTCSNKNKSKASKSCDQLVRPTEKISPTFSIRLFIAWLFY